MRGQAGAGTASGGAVFGSLAWPRTFPRGVEAAQRVPATEESNLAASQPPGGEVPTVGRSERGLQGGFSTAAAEAGVVAWRPAPSHAHGRARAVEGSKWVLKPCYAHARAVPRRPAAHLWCLHSTFFQRSTHTYRQKGQCMRVHQRISTRFGRHGVEASG